MSKKSIASVLIITAYFFYSCSNHIVFCEFQSVPDKAWNKQTAFLFHFDVKDDSVPYDIYMQLRNNASYPYQNIWILFEVQQSTENAVKDTIEYKLADDTGRWTGNGITLYQNQFSLRENYHFPDTGQYTISLSHGMYDNRLKGIEDIGLLVEKAK